MKILKTYEEYSQKEDLPTNLHGDLFGKLEKYPELYDDFIDYILNSDDEWDKKEKMDQWIKKQMKKYGIPEDDIKPTEESED